MFHLKRQIICIHSSSSSSSPSDIIAEGLLRQAVMSRHSQDTGQPLIVWDVTSSTHTIVFVCMSRIGSSLIESRVGRHSIISPW